MRSEKSITTNNQGDTEESPQRKKPAPRFTGGEDEFREEYLPMSFYTQQTRAASTANTNPSSAVGENSESYSNSEDTQIYEVEGNEVQGATASTPITHSDKQTSNTQPEIRYNLRTRSVPAQLNNDSIEQPAIVRWMDKLARALDD
ncbi:hypothetical protein JTE90_025049 [Oedothorax gibbosus]|uniref:Uncharacterized protein n=1 Tax=Oedothorax gibbosus TaxID=931172 RepID=A0AAV6TTE4_9ARAC|nr:hypothetical protein JTE90_025049 [Oedothorax gibbosus]